MWMGLPRLIILWLSDPSRPKSSANLWRHQKKSIGLFPLSHEGAVVTDLHDEELLISVSYRAHTTALMFATSGASPSPPSLWHQAPTHRAPQMRSPDVFSGVCSVAWFARNDFLSVGFRHAGVTKIVTFVRCVHHMGFIIWHAHCSVILRVDDIVISQNLSRS